jgi:hypothetical protein
MGVECKQYLIPKPNSFRPDAKCLSALIDALVRERWIHAPTPKPAGRAKGGLVNGLFWKRSTNIRTGLKPIPAIPSEAELAAMPEELFLTSLVDSGEDAGLRHPLATGAPYEESYWELNIHVSDDYIYHVSDIVDPFDGVVCKCGEALVYDPGGGDVFYSQRIRYTCPSCGKTFDPSRRPAIVRDGWTGEETKVTGGAAYRFAVVADFGKCWPHDATDGIELHADLVKLCHRITGKKFYQITDFY